MSDSAADLVVRTFDDSTQGDALRLINSYIGNWPYCRAVDTGLVEHWRTLANYQPEEMLIAYRGREARAFLHGEFREGKRAIAHLVAMAPGAVGEAVELLRRFEQMARQVDLQRLVGPHWATAAFYGSYILGREPYHPHWAAEGTEVFVRAGCRISHPGVILIRDMSETINVEPAPAGYEIRDAEKFTAEYDADALGFETYWQGQTVARCGARLYRKLLSPIGGPVGQLGHVGTDEAHRGKGLARIMSQIALMRLCEMGASECLIATGLDNYPALRAYERVGFQRRYNINEWSKELRPA